MFSSLSYSQEIRNDSLYKNAFYIQAFGNGIFYSLNYDRIIINKEKYKVTSGAGFSVYPQSIFDISMNALVIPCDINILFGKKNKFLEMGLGITFGFTDDEGERFNLASCVRLGYRSVNYKKFFFRAAFTPFFWIEKLHDYNYQTGKEEFVNKFHALPWAGISVGEVF